MRSPFAASVLVLALFGAAGGCAEEEPAHENAGARHAQARAALSGETLLWTQRSEMRRRILPAMVDQPSRQRLLAYGGFTTDGVLADTWEWDGLGWIRRTSRNNPGPRSAPATTYDSRRQRVLLYGGVAALAPLYPLAGDDLWEWNGDDWSTISTAHSPPAAAASVFAWDTAANRGLLFGGGLLVPTTDGNAEMQAIDLFWSFDGRDWTELPLPAVRPEARAFASTVWDPVGRRMLVHGGFRRAQFYNGLVISDPSNLCGDTWSWDGTTWTQLAGGAIEGEFGFSSMAFDAATQKIVLLAERPIGARTEGGGVGETALYTLEGDGWKWLSSRPTADELGPVPGNTIFSTSHWSSANQAMLGWGGITLPGATTSAVSISGLWLASPSSGWSHRAPSASLDSLLEAASAAVADEAILFGGYSGVNELRNKTYGWDGGRWTLLGPRPDAPPGATPSARRSHAMATLGASQVLLFGGNDGSTDPLNDSWIWDHGTRSWTRVDLGEGAVPPARERASMAKLGENEVVLFGGQQGNALLGDTWVFSNDPPSWRQITSLPAPPARHSAAMAPAGSGSLLFSGLGAGSAALDDRWNFDGVRWVASAQNNLTRRYRAQLGYEAVSGRTFLVGGSGDTLRPDVWDFTTDPATPLAPVVRESNELPPRRRQWFSLMPSPRSGSVVEFGGKSDDGDDERLSDTWQLRSYGLACTETAECGPGRFCTDGVCCEASSCGPCRTCANPSAPGFCSARGTYGSEPECPLEEGLACSEEGSCRGANEKPCTANAQCASNTCVGLQTGQGTCCALEGCAVQCDGNDLRNPDGTRTSCGAYGCEGQSCKTSCASIADCAGDAVCSGGACIVQTTAQGDSGGCACRATGATTGWPSPFTALGAAAVLGLVLRRRPRI